MVGVASMRKSGVSKIMAECGIVSNPVSVRFKRNGWFAPVTVEDLRNISAAHLEFAHCRILEVTSEQLTEAQNKRAAWELERAGFPQSESED